jgi:LysR family glycine cleavage system transcriptional activator
VWPAEPFDIAIRYGSENRVGFDALKLSTSKLLVVGSPQLLRKNSPVRLPLDCLRLPLLQDRDRLNWPAWLRANGSTGVPLAARKGPSFANDSLLIAAAAASQGLALVRDIHAENLILSGQLKVAIATSMEPFHSYYLVLPSRIAQRPHILAFKDWLLGELSTPRTYADRVGNIEPPAGTLRH